METENSFMSYGLCLKPILQWSEEREYVCTYTYTYIKSKYKEKRESIYI